MSSYSWCFAVLYSIMDKVTYKITIIGSA
jgi:hypothetical protein